MMKFCMTILVLLLALKTTGFAQEKSADEIAKELANPNNSLASLTFKNQFRWYAGDLPNADDQGNYTLLFQPAFPFALETAASGGKANLFIRPARRSLLAAKGRNANKRPRKTGQN